MVFTGGRRTDRTQRFIPVGGRMDLETVEVAGPLGKGSLIDKSEKPEHLIITDAVCKFS